MIRLNYKQVQTILDMFGGETDDGTEVVIQQTEGYSGPGLYAWDGEYPEDGATFLEP